MSYKQLSFVDYRDNYYESAEHTLVDVRTPMEYAGGHVPNAINIPLNALHTHIGEVSKDKPVVVVCASGNRSQEGSATFAAAGYSEVYNLQGGTMVWMMNGLPLER